MDPKLQLNGMKDPDSAIPEGLPVKIVNPGEIPTKMEDIGGYEEAKLEVIEFVNFLKNREQYEKLGAHLPRGVLLYGPPGTGKTLIARATAGEAGIPFLACASARFLSGKMGPEKLKMVFDLAKDHAPCVLYFDEIDCIGRTRRTGMGQTVVPQLLSLTEEILVQLDGFETDRDAPVLVFGSTNNLGSLDNALLRPGRFDRTICMQTPDFEGRISIYNVHTKPLVCKIDTKKLLMRLALLSPNFTGAQIAAACNEAAMIAARNEAESIEMKHFEEAVDRIRSGQRKKKPLEDWQKPVKAYHEAAHAICGWYLRGVQPPTSLSILPKTHGMEGTCSQENICNVGPATKDLIMNNIAQCLSGRVAEEMMPVFKDKEALRGPNALSGRDIGNATELAMRIVVEWGLGNTFGNMNCLNSFSRGNMRGENVLPIPEDKKLEAYNEIRGLLNEAEELARKTLNDYRKEFESLATELINRDAMNFDELEFVLGPSPKPPVREDFQLNPGLPNSLAGWNNRSLPR